MPSGNGRPFLQNNSGLSTLLKHTRKLQSISSFPIFLSELAYFYRSELANLLCQVCVPMAECMYLEQPCPLQRGANIHLVPTTLLLSSFFILHFFLSLGAILLYLLLLNPIEFIEQLATFYCSRQQ